MVVNKDKRKAFGTRLGIVLDKAEVKQTNIGELIEKSRQFVWQVLRGDSLFSADQFNSVYEFLIPRVKEYDLKILAELFVEAKGDLNLHSMAVQIADNALIEIIIEDLYKITPKQQKEIVRIIEQMKIDNLGHMAKNAGLENYDKDPLTNTNTSSNIIRETPGEYKGRVGIPADQNKPKPKQTKPGE